MPRTSLGEAEHLVLVGLLHLGGESYAVPIRHTIEERSGRAIARAAVFIALQRLERRGLLTSRIGEPTAPRGGRPTRLFKITALGRRELRLSHQTFRRMWADAEHLITRSAR